MSGIDCLSVHLADLRVGSASRSTAHECYGLAVINRASRFSFQVS
jgi:hypothetical protein